jgi:hypothetical protein
MLPREGRASRAPYAAGPAIWAPGAPLAASDAFHAAFVASTALTREARRLADLEYRYTTRYCIWETPDEDAPWRAQAGRLYHRRQAAIDRAEDAHGRLNRLWTDASYRLFGFGRVYDQPSVALRRLVA